MVETGRKGGGDDKVEEGTGKLAGRGLGRLKGSKTMAQTN